MVADSGELLTSGRAFRGRLQPAGAGVARELRHSGRLDASFHGCATDKSRSPLIEDGWRYFVHGWSQVVADEFDIPMPREAVAELARMAASIR